MSVQIPDSLMIEVDYILNLAKPNQEAFRYFLSEFLNKYGQPKYIGHDGIAAHIIDNYYSKGMAPWVTEENLGKLKDNADNIRPTMLGKKMPDIITYQEDSTPVRLYDILADYTILFIWDPECGSCKKAAPDIVNFYNKYKTESLKVLTICNQAGEKYKSCWPSVVEKGMEGLINTGDEYQRYQSKVRNTSVPKIYFLDKDKKILLKDFPSEKLEEIFENFKKNTNNAN
jgi:thiol-disulfide isomerase/thioredoxin